MKDDQGKILRAAGIPRSYAVLSLTKLGAPATPIVDYIKEPGFITRVRSSGECLIFLGDKDDKMAMDATYLVGRALMTLEVDVLALTVPQLLDWIEGKHETEIEDPSVLILPRFTNWQWERNPLSEREAFWVEEHLMDWLLSGGSIAMHVNSRVNWWSERFMRTVKQRGREFSL